MAKLYFHYAAMNAGKSTILLQAAYNYGERGMSTFLLKPSIDTRDGTDGEISSRIGLAAPAYVFGSEDDLANIVLKQQTDEGEIACILVDEAQFLTEAQVWQLATVADDQKIPVMCYGLRTDFRGKLFTGSAALLAIADELREIRTICWCGKKATMVVRVGPDGERQTDGAQIEIGDNDRYVSLCRTHWSSGMIQHAPQP